MVTRKPPSIISLEDFDESINMLIYGDSGAGKTVFAGSAPRVLFVGTERGTISAKRQGSTADLWPVEGWEDIVECYKYLKKGDHGYNWVSMDSGTAMQQYDLRWILDNAVKDNPNRDPDIPAIQDHQKWQNSFKRFVKNFCDLPVNVLFTATTMRSEDEEGENIILPDFQGKGYGISQWVCAQMHVVGYLSVKRRGKGEEKEIWRRIQFQTVPPYFGKDRYNCLGEFNEAGHVTKPYIDNPTLAQVEELIKSSGTAVIEENERGHTTTARRKSTATTRRPVVRRRTS
jgi:hypothetical protein